MSSENKYINQMDILKSIFQTSKCPEGVAEGKIMRKNKTQSI